MIRRRLPVRQEGVDYEIVSDGKTVWVNVPGGNIARFGLGGIDIHREPMQQPDEGACLFCTHEFTTLDDWKTFVEKMRELHGIEVPDHNCPDRLKDCRHG